MGNMIKNIDFKTALELEGTVQCQPGQVVSRTLVQNKSVSLTLFAFDKGEEISTHASSGDAMVYIIDGNAKITIDGEAYHLDRGKTIVMPADVPHALYAEEQFKMMLTVVFPA